MCMPVMRGLESNHGFASFEEKTVIISLKSTYSPLPLFPHQDVVPLIDPCSSFVSPAAGAEQQSSVGRVIEAG